MSDQQYASNKTGQGRKHPPIWYTQSWHSPCLDATSITGHFSANIKIQWKQSVRCFTTVSQQMSTAIRHAQSNLPGYCLSGSVLFFSHPRSKGWPCHGRTFSIYPCPLSFWLTLPWRVLSKSWWCPSRPCVVFLVCVHLALFLALSFSRNSPFKHSPLFPHGVTIPCFDSV